MEVDYGVDGRLFLAVKSLHSCTEICVRVGRIKSRLFTVDVGLRQGRVLSPLLFIVYIRGDQTKARRPVCTFFQAPRCRLWTAVQHSIKCWLSRKSHCIRPSSGQTIANSVLGSKSLATPGLYELDRQSQPSRRGCHICELQDQPFTFCRRFGTASIFSTGSSACTRSVVRCV